MKVRDVMTTAVITADPEMSFKETAELLLDSGVTGLPVVDDQRRVLGLVTEADLMSKEAFGARRRRPLDVLVGTLKGDKRWIDKSDGLRTKDIMTTDVVTADPDEDGRMAARRMLDRGVKRLPVVEDGTLVGIISRHDLLRVFHRPDSDIAAEIEAKLASPLHAPLEHQVVFGVDDGVVTLTGSVEFAGEVPVVEGLAWRVPGVIHVISHVTYERRDGE